MSKKKPKQLAVYHYGWEEREELRQLFEDLTFVKKEIVRVARTPLTEMSEHEKDFLIKSLDDRESYLIMKMAECKGLYIRVHEGPFWDKSFYRQKN
jgi:hypothetical protein